MFGVLSATHSKCPQGTLIGRDPPVENHSSWGDLWHTQSSHSDTYRVQFVLPWPFPIALVYSSNVICVTFKICANVLEMMDYVHVHRPLGHNVSLCYLTCNRLDTGKPLLVSNGCCWSIDKGRSFHYIQFRIGKLEKTVRISFKVTYYTTRCKCD